MKTKEKKSGKLNVKLLEKIREHILDEPKRMNMGCWITQGEDLKPACKTVGCIAGWAVALSIPKTRRTFAKDLPVSSVDIERMAEELLRLPHYHTDELFLPLHWPERFTHRLNKYAPGSQKYAAVVSARIKAYEKKYADWGKDEE